MFLNEEFIKLFVGIIILSGLLFKCNSIYIPDDNQPTSHRKIGIKSLSWQGTNIENNTNIQIHQNYSKIHHNKNNFDQSKIIKINDNLDFSQSINNQIEFFGNSEKLIDSNIGIYQNCPENLTGVFVYEFSCGQYLNCWKGRGHVQNCSPGTLFNPKTLECDFSEKVQCITGPNRISREIQIISKKASCPRGFSGMIPHYTVCSKYIQCDNGREIPMDCPPGTMFDIKTNRCDFPYKSECAISNHIDQREFGKKIIKIKPYSGNSTFQITPNQNNLGYSGFDSRGRSYRILGSGNLINDHLGEFSQGQKRYQSDYLILVTNLELEKLKLTQNYCQNSNGEAFSHPGNCSLFLQCYKGKLHIGICTYGTLFNPKTKICDFGLCQNGQISSGQGLIHSGQHQTHFGQHQIDFGQHGQREIHSGQQQINFDQHGQREIHSGQREIHSGQHQIDFGQHSQREIHSGQHQINFGQHSQGQNYSGQREIHPGQRQIDFGQHGQREIHSGQQQINFGQHGQGQNYSGQREIHSRQHQIDFGQHGQREIHSGQRRIDFGQDGQRQIPSGQHQIHSGQHQIHFGQHGHHQIPSGQHQIHSGQHGQHQIPSGQLQIDFGQQQIHSGQHQIHSGQHQTHSGQFQSSGNRPKCPLGETGLFPHPLDCKKFLNCANGQTHIQDCGPGTVFNPNLKVCDWPHNVKCNVHHHQLDRTSKVVQEDSDQGNFQNQNYQNQNSQNQNSQNENSQNQNFHNQNFHNQNFRTENSLDQNLAISRFYGVDPDQFCVGKKGFFENAKNCTIFFNCRNGKLSIGICHAGANFNPWKNDCDSNWRCQNQRFQNHHHQNHHQQNHHDQNQWNIREEENRGINLDVVRNDSNWDQDRNQGRIDGYVDQWGSESRYSGNRENRRDQIGNQSGSTYQGRGQDSFDQNRLDQNQFQITSLSFESSHRNQDQNLNQNNIIQSNQTERPILTTDTNADYIFELDDLVEVSPDFIGKCEENDFICPGGKCLKSSSVCDGIKNCINGEDEVNCGSYLTHYKEIRQTKMAVREIAKFQNTTVAFCAKKCLEADSFKCKAFNYRKSDGMCFMLDTNIGQSGKLFQLPIYDYYENKKYSVDCSGKFLCGNQKCLENNQICDGKFDCVDKEDEKNCDAEKIGYSIQLVGSNKSHEGAIQVKAFGKVGFICDDQFSIKDAHVVCKELGFEEGALEVKGNSFFDLPSEIRDNDYLMDDVGCLGNETSLKDCNFNGWGVHNCMAKEVVGVICKSPQSLCPFDKWKCESVNECIPLDFLCDHVSDCSDKSDEANQYCESPTEIRLANGKKRTEGRLEIRYRGTWGTVCDDDFNDDAAKVVCRYLGFEGPAEARKNGVYGPGLGPIWLDQVFCQGNETSLQECDHWDWGKHNCDHGEDVGIICEGYPSGTPRNVKNIEPPRQISPGKCGLRNDKIFMENSDVHFRLVKGSLAKKGDYPWQASIRIKGQSSREHWCGGVVISEIFVLTAAHCLNGYQKGGFVIVAGDYDRNEDEGTEQVANIEEFYIHEDFRKGTKMNNDICLIKLKGNGFTLGTHVQAICLPDQNLHEEGLNCSISGFGSVKSGKAVASKELRAGFVPIRTREVCSMPHIYGDALTEGMICAGTLDGGVDACDGDSGGPLACLKDGVFTLVGLTSWGQHCGYANKPGVYVKISYYRGWIDQMMKKHAA